MRKTRKRGAQNTAAPPPSPRCTLHAVALLVIIAQLAVGLVLQKESTVSRWDCIPFSSRATERLRVPAALRSKRSRRWESVRSSAHARAGTGAPQAGCGGSAPRLSAAHCISNCRAWRDAVRCHCAQKVRKKEEDDFSWRDEDTAAETQQAVESTPPPPLPGAPASLATADADFLNSTCGVQTTDRQRVQAASRA